MIIIRTPFRISFVGGSTDLKRFYKNHEGRVISCSINKYIYIFINKKVDDRIKISYSKNEHVSDINLIKHSIFRESLKFFKINKGIEIASISDMPTKGTGLGSSSAFTVGLVNGLLNYKNKLSNKKNVAENACKIEIDKCHFPIGKQDQYISSYGGLKKIIFKTTGEVNVKSIKINPNFKKKLFNSIILVDTGKNRLTNEVLSKLDQKIKLNKHILDKMKKLVDLTKFFEKEIINSDIESLGEIISESWNIKKNLDFNISNFRINEIIDEGIKIGAYGAKLLGAGAGGHVLFLANKNTKIKIKKKFYKLSTFDIKCDENGSILINK